MPTLIQAQSRRPVLRQGLSKVVLFGAQAPDAAFLDDWVLPHELFHLTNPVLQQRVPWFTEGITTYYDNVLRARAATRTPERAWRALWKGVMDTCGANQVAPLQDASRTMHQTHAYQRVYWGGACTAFLLDVGLRELPGNSGGLDAWLLGLRAESLEQSLPPATLLGRLHGALPKEHPAHHRLVHSLESVRALSLDSLFTRLGVIPTKDSVTLDDSAPLSGIRRAIMAPGSQPAGSVDAGQRRATSSTGR